MPSHFSLLVPSESPPYWPALLLSSLLPYLPPPPHLHPLSSLLLPFWPRPFSCPKPRPSTCLVPPLLIFQSRPLASVLTASTLQSQIPQASLGPNVCLPALFSLPPPLQWSRPLQSSPLPFSLRPGHLVLQSLRFLPPLQCLHHPPQCHILESLFWRDPPHPHLWQLLQHRLLVPLLSLQSNVWIS